MQGRFKSGKGIPAELAIIVGQGQHPQEEGPKLRDAVEQLLHQQLHMPVGQLQAGASTVQLKVAAHAAIENMLCLCASKRIKYNCIVASAYSPLPLSLHVDFVWQDGAEESSKVESVHASQTSHKLNLEPLQAAKTPASSTKRQNRKENKGRVVVTKDALLQWLHSKASKDHPDIQKQHRSAASS